ncbi:M4 family metallopeptidase [Bradyrhizobium sp. Arg816]|uniref:M4 family metallopeptidase n=1 Tax=Bradyrhizobium sp. Arg816 TaxID=2998491 RepID=UPI00249EB666|nr:M4 family metallopeptidase [Bradyrhizobium sp. Arg816]MDI3564646.1 M4 family metallopeptidase [Bradyrhizobium sp. Arg816]
MMFSSRCQCINCITPPHILKKLLNNSDNRIRDAALRTLLSTSRLRGERAVRGLLAAAAAPSSHGRRTISDCGNSTQLGSATVARTEDGAKSKDNTVNRAFEGLGDTREFYQQILDRDSIDGRGMRLNGFVHYGDAFNNAFWDGTQMVFGDGDGVLFTDFTKSIDVIAHELTHGVTEMTAGLVYHNQSGALNESVSDVFGSLVKQWTLKQTANQADWLIGAEVFTPDIGADALRSMKDPGKAFNNPTLGKDPQPDHMRKYVNLPDTDDGDNGGVHINSGIPNKAFFLTATGIGGFAWEAPAHIWYAALQASTPTTEFQEFADTTYLKAGQLFGSTEQQAVAAAWKEVGLSISGARSLGGTIGRMRRVATNGHDDAADISRQIAELTAQITALSRTVEGMQQGRPH